MHLYIFFFYSKNQEEEWIKVDLGARRVISGIVTQGNVERKSWVTKFYVALGNSANYMRKYKDENNLPVLFDGSSDPDTPHMVFFSRNITAR